MSTWDQIGSATANLTLSNTNFSTTFDQTSAVTWTWANTIAATSTIPQTSPIISFCGSWWGFTSPTNTTGASLMDNWTIQDRSGTTALGNISSISETSGLVTLGVSSGSITDGALATLAGLTTATWLNGQRVFVLIASPTQLTFVDPTNHADQVFTTETGQIAQATSVLAINHSGTPNSVCRFHANLGLIDTTAATPTSRNITPGLTFSTNFWTGSTSSLELWNLQGLVGSGTNASSTLQIAHVGTSGPTNVNLNSGTSLTWGVIGNSVTGDTSISRLGPGSLAVGNGSGSVGYGKLTVANLNIGSLSVYSNNASAIAGGLSTGDLYRTGNDPDVVCVVN